MVCQLCSAIGETYRLIYEDEHVFSIVPECPLKPGHIMILPKRHVKSMSDLTESESKSLFCFIDISKEKIKEIYGEPAMVVINTGSHGTQEHIHIHVLPSKGNLRELVSNLEGVPEREPMPKEEMQKIKETLCDSL